MIAQLVKTKLAYK